MNKPHLKTSLIIFFFTVLFLPLIFIFYSKIRIFQIAKHSQDISKDWSLFVNGKHIDEIDLPRNIYSFHKKNQITKITLKKIINTELNGDGYIFLGRIADIDELYVNGNRIAGTGKFYPDGRWDRSTVRAYPFKCNKTCDVEVLIQKIGTEFAGVYEGPIFLTKNSKLNRYVDWINFFEKTYTFYFGFILILVGFYYLFIFSLGTPNTYYSYFSFTSIFIGIFDIAVSRILYGFTESFNLIFKLNALSCILAGFFYIIFLNTKFLLSLRKTILAFSVITFFCFIMAIFFRQMDFIRDFFVTWFPFFILTLFFATYKILKHHFKSLDVMYFIVLFLIPLSIMNDMLNVYSVFITFYTLPFTFGIIVFALVLQLANETTFSHVSLIKQVDARTRDLRSAIEQLKGLEKLKEKFFSNISHDLKTPVTIIQGALTRLKEKFTNQGELLDSIEVNTNKLSKMISNILLDTKLKEGRIELQLKTIHIKQFFDHLSSNYQILADRERIRWEYKNECDKQTAVFDPEYMERIVDNIVSNAVKYTKTTPRKEKNIEFCVWESGENFLFSVEDSGMGIPKNEREKVFERFSQSSLTDLKVHGGFGIGLSFVKEMLEKHQGMVTLDESRWGGVRVTCMVPMQAHKNAPVFEIVADTKSEVLSTPKSDQITIPVHAYDRSNLLICEDNAEIAKMLISTFEGVYNIFYAQNGQKGIDVLSKNKIDCILCDYVMPLMDGAEMLRVVKQDKLFSQIPFLFLTSQSDENLIENMIESGATDYITKPFVSGILKARVHRAIESVHQRDQIEKERKYTTLGLMSAGISHELKNPIHAMSNYLNILQSRFSEFETDGKNSDQFFEQFRDLKRSVIDPSLGFLKQSTDRMGQKDKWIFKR